MNASNALPALTIANVCIGQDSQGRYCLNDLHKAAGGKNTDRPQNWLAIEQTQELVNILDDGKLASEQNQAVSIIKGGNTQQGTFVVKELVYAYAMWISPAFHLAVIRAYDAMVMQPALNLSQLIPVFTGIMAGQPTQLISARDLHQFLESKRQFIDWIKYRTTQCELIENQDFIIVSQFSGGRPSLEYHLPLGVAKMLSMAKRTDKGRQVLRYLIDCEKPTHHHALPNLSHDTMTLAEFLAAQDHLQTMSEQLKTVQVILTGADCFELTLRAKQGGAA